MSGTAWPARFESLCPGCHSRIHVNEVVEWSSDGTKVIHAAPLCRLQDPTKPPAVCPVHNIALPSHGICDDCQ